MAQDQQIEKILLAIETYTDILESKIGLDPVDIKMLRKGLKSLESRDDKAYMDMLRSVHRNHYLLNQMVDRKARIMLSLSIVLQSVIIGSTMTPVVEKDWQMYILFFLGICCFFSILAAMIAVLPERSHGRLTDEDILNKRGNPLFFGNFKNLTEQVYENTMMEMVNDRDFVYRSMIQDIYHLGQTLEKKRKFLRLSLIVFMVGICLTLLLVLAFKIWIL